MTERKDTPLRNIAESEACIADSRTRRLIRDRERYRKNRKQHIRRVVRRQRARYATDQQYVAYQSIKSRMRYAIRSQSSKKTSRTFQLVGCTAKELVRHLESKFLEGMSWSNRNEWHIDHIIPVSAFDLTTEDGQRAAFHYTNLQPLWAKDNRTKSARPPKGQRMFSFGYVNAADEQRAKARKGGSR